MKISKHILFILLIISGCAPRVLDFDISNNSAYSSNLHIIDKRSKNEQSYLTNRKNIENIFGSYTRTKIYWGDENFTPSGLELFKQSLEKANTKNSNIGIEINKFRITEDRNNSYIGRSFLNGMADELTFRNRIFEIQCSFSGLINGKAIELSMSQSFKPGGTYPGFLGETQEVKNAVTKCVDSLAIMVLR